MTAQPRPLDDATIEAAIAGRAPGHADAMLLAGIVAAASSTPQIRSWTLPVIGGRRAGWAVLVAAVLLVGAVLLFLGGGSDRTTPTQAPSQPAAVGPSPSSTTSPSAAPARTCATETTTVTIGADMPPTSTAPMTVPEGILDQGIYVTEPSDNVYRPADVWSIRAGSATRIASVVGADFDVVQIDDISADGRLALLQVGALIADPVSTCDDLYLLSTDGTSVTRLSEHGRNEHTTGGRFSRDGRYVAFRFDDLSGHTPAVGLVDLEGDRTPRLTECAETSMFDLAWAPTDDRLAVICGARLDILPPPDLALAPTSTDLPFRGEALVELGWQDSETTLVTTAVIDGSTDPGPPINAPIQFRTVAAGAVSQPTVVSPPIGQGNPGSAISPDGQALAVFATPSDFEASGWYVIDVSTGAARKVSGITCSDIGWSADSRSVLYVKRDPLTSPPSGAPTTGRLLGGQPTLTVVDLGTGQVQGVGTMPINYIQGFWRGS
jgi:hypothetical protein